MKHKILILGVTGMLGHTLYTELSKRFDLSVQGTLRDKTSIANRFPSTIIENMIEGVDISDLHKIESIINSTRPDVVINCIGVIKQLPSANDSINTISINALLPHQLARICAQNEARLIHISTDCVFDGTKGNYTEKDVSDAKDLYGKSKHLGELENYDHCVTLRTSIIGHELNTRYGLIEWFLAQKDQVKGFTKAIYTGFPTVELAYIIAQYIIPDTSLKGLYQVASEPINKYELLKLVAHVYKKNIQIRPDHQFFCDRSLLSYKFNEAVNYKAPAWPELVEKMHRHYMDAPFYHK
jgi:dTDP-4-dehydrorhamnose reductase